MILVKLTNRVYNVIHLPQAHSVYLLVELMEAHADLFVIVGIIFVMALVEHGQDGFIVPKVRWMLCNMLFQGFQELFHYYHLQKFW